MNAQITDYTETDLLTMIRTINKNMDVAIIKFFQTQEGQEMILEQRAQKRESAIVRKLLKQLVSAAQIMKDGPSNKKFAAASDFCDTRKFIEALGWTVVSTARGYAAKKTTK